MDKRKSILNVSVSIGFKMVTMIAVILVKRFLIQICGNDINGLNALYLSIIGTLSVAELGVGSAITFCMYKPIVENDLDTVSALYHLFRRLYLIISGVILVAGLAITPFITYFAKDYATLDVNFQLTFVLMLVSVVITYCFASKTSLINAYKNNYITTAISSGGILLQYILQIVVLLVTGSFVWYLICRIVAAALQWLITEMVARKKYTPILRNVKKLQGAVKGEVLKNIKAMFMHRVGSTLVNTVNGMVISIFIGVVALGEYSNYTTILTTLTALLKLVFTSLTSVFGHLYVESDVKTTQKYCDAFHVLNFVLGTVFCLGYYAVIDNLIAILFSADLIVAKSLSFVIALDGFVQFMRQSTLVFREATGTFYHDRWKPLFEGVINLVLSILLVQWVGVTGVIISTIITNLLICHIIEPYVLYKNAFSVSPKKYYLRNYSMICLFTVALIAMHFCMQTFESVWVGIFINGLISLGFSVVVCLLILLLNKDSSQHLLNKFKERLHKSRQ